MLRLPLFLIILVSTLFSKEIIIGFAQDTLSNDWRVAQVEEVKTEILKHKNLKLIVKNAKGKVSNQIKDIESFIEQKVDFIITSPINAQITSEVLKKAIENKIKVILISRGINTSDYTTFIAPDNKQIGRNAAVFLANKINYEGTILMLQGVQGATSTIQREEGFEETTKKYPKIKIIKKRANYLRSDAIKVMEEIYSNNIKFDAIYSHSDSMLVGARQVIKKHQNVINFPSVGIDYIKEAKLAIEKNEQSATFLYPTSGKEGVKAIIDIINNKPIEKNIIIDSQIITKENTKYIKPIF